MGDVGALPAYPCGDGPTGSRASGGGPEDGIEDLRVPDIEVLEYQVLGFAEERR